LDNSKKMISKEKHIERLLNEWKEHGKIIVGCDFDDTLRPWTLAEQEDCQDVINLLKNVRQTGAYLVIFTACKPDRYPEILSYCGGLGLSVDSINENPIKLPYGNDRKIYANIFLDDRAGLEQSCDILSTAMYQYRGWLKSNEKLDDIA